MVVTLSKKLVRRALYCVPLSWWSKFISKNEFVYCYHLAADEALAHIRHLYSYKTPPMFKDDLEYIGRTCDFVDLDGLFQHRVRQRPNGRSVALITVDDGLSECYTVLRPLLRRYGAKAIFFVITDCIDNRAMFYRHKASLCIERVVIGDEDQRAELLAAVNSRFGQSCRDVDSFTKFVLSIRADRAALIDKMCETIGIDVGRYLAEQKPYMTEDQIRKLAQEGFFIGAHSTNHFDFTKIHPDEMERQIVQSCEAVAQITGRTPVDFAFPFDLRGLDRGLLTRIARANPIIGTMFGADGIVHEPPFIHRILSDAPRDARPGESNLRRLLRENYVDYVKFQLLGMSREQAGS